MDIREMRNRLGETQSEFAKRYHIPFRTIQNREAGVRVPPAYITSLPEDRVRADLVNCRTAALPKYDPKKTDLPKRSDFVGSVSWLRAVSEQIGQPTVFALDEALMCQGSFGGRSNESILDMQGITEALGRYYYKNGSSFAGLFPLPGYEESFTKLADEAVHYYNS